MRTCSRVPSSTLFLIVMLCRTDNQWSAVNVKKFKVNVVKFEVKGGLIWWEFFIVIFQTIAQFLKKKAVPLQAWTGP
jgi:hypothetical protein